MDRSALIRLAGFLAEQSVQVLQITTGGVERTLAARSTDLPSELEALFAQGGSLTAPSLDLVIRCEPQATNIAWQSSDQAVTMQVAKALAPA
jgi:hypothetical protein